MYKKLLVAFSLLILGCSTIIAGPGLLISELLVNPSGTDSPFEYVEFRATKFINFALTPYSVVVANNGTATANGWITGGAISYGFNINTGTVMPGDVVYVGGSSMAPTGVKLRIINTGTTAGDGFGSFNTAGVFGNGGTNADAIGVFDMDISLITNSTVPIDAIFYGTSMGTAIVSAGAAGYQLPINDSYIGGKLQAGSFLATDPGAFNLIATGTFDTITNTYLANRVWTSGAFTDGTSTVTLTLPPASFVFSVDNQTVTEAAGVISANISIASSNINPSSVDVVIIPFGTADVGSDITYSTTTITFPASATGTLPVSITINEDLLPENSEYFVLRLQNPVNAVLGAITQQTIYIQDNENSTPVATNEVTMSFVSSFSNGTAGTNSSEIVAHDPISQRLFLANSIGRKLDIVDFSNPAAMALLASIDISSYGNINSVAVKNGIVACAIENNTPELDGFVVFFDTNGVFQKQVIVGAMPDMITFNNAGTRVLTANEGQPNDAYTIDPEGSVSIIDISGGIPALLQTNVTTALFTSFNSQMATLKASGVRIFGPGATVAQDMEPEYIALSADDQTAYVALQENNAIAYINMTTNTITDIKPLGFKDYAALNNGIDATNIGSNVNIANWPIKGVYMPDAMTRFNVGGIEYLITANEGDARAYGGLNEETTIGSAGYVLDATAFPYASVMKSNANLGRLKCTNQLGDTDADGDFDQIYTYGARSFSIWNATTGTLVYDSGSDMEKITANNPTYGALFNCSNTNITKKDRSDDKGPEPEGVVTASIAGNMYAFVSMERVGGLMAFNINNPAAPVFVQYVNNRGLTGLTGDRGPEGTLYISQENSPNGKALIVLGNEVSSTTSVYEIACPLAAAVNTASGATTFCSGDTVSLSSSTLPGATYAWYNGVNPIIGATASTYAATVSGTYSVQLNNVGCTFPSDTIAVTVNSVPVSTVTAGGSTTFCAGGTVTFSTAAGNTYQWLFNGAPIVGETAANYSANASGNYSVEITNASSCSATSTVQTVLVNPLPDATFTAAGPTSVCDGDSVVFNANSGLTYQWFFNGAVIPGATSINYSTFDQGNYSVVVNDGSCSATSSDTLAVTVNSLPLSTVTAGGSTTFCAGGTVTFSTAAGNTYQWLFNGAPIVGETAANYSANASGNYSVEITNASSCSATSTDQTVLVNALPDATFTAAGPTSVCDGDSVVFTANSGLTYQWFFNGAPISGATSINYSAFDQGNYSVVVNDGSCSATSLDTLITIFSLPAVPVISQSGSVLTSTVATTYQWYLNGSPIVGETSQTYSVTANGSYTVLTSNAAGCEEISAPWIVTTTDIASLQNSNEVNIYPNPYSEFTTIQLNILENANVLVEVYNVLGEKIQTILNTVLSAGNYKYDFGAKKLGYTSGIYFVKIMIDNKVSVIKIIENN